MKYILIITLLILIVGLWFLIWHWQGNIHKTFSQNAAHSKQSVRYYIALFSIVSPLLWLFFSGWFAPQYGLHETFLAVVFTAVVLQWLCTFFPEGSRTTTVIHRMLTAGSAVMMMPTLWLIAQSEQALAYLPMLYASLICMLTLYLIASVYQRGLRYALLYQIGYYLLFFIPIVILTYH